MASKELYCSLTSGGNPIDIVAVEVAEAYKQACARCSFEVESIAGIDLNSTIITDLGYVGDHAQVFKGYVDEISYSRMPGLYRVACRDILKRAIEHYIVTTDLENPWSRENIQSEDLVGALLAEAGIVNYAPDVSHYTFGTNGPAEFNLISSGDAIGQLLAILPWTCYAVNGVVYYKDIWPVPVGAPVHTFIAGDAGQIISIEYSQSTDNLRNKCIAFGADGIYADASAVSPFLPAGFYKTSIVSSELIDTQAMAQSSCDYNLTLYNKLTEALHVEIEGDQTVRARETVHVTEAFTGVDSDWFVYSARHRLDAEGATYQTSLALVR